MPITFIDIERRTNWRIAIFFMVLLCLYAAIGFILTFPSLNGLYQISPRFWLVLLTAALLAAGIHFWFAAYNTVDSVIRGLDARPPDPQDEVHRIFLNIIEELRVVTGGKQKIRCAVIPSLSLNALAAADLKGTALIAITEGLLSRLSRPQIEAVAAHEAHHILSGDCLETTVAASLFGTLSSALERIRTFSQNRIFSLPAFLLAWLLLQLGHLLNMFISREREYRADAASVRMTRNPIALAEALHLLTRSWRGAGFIGSGYEMLCIVNPQASNLDESEGFWSDLFSTHPPIGKRINVLLGMARIRRADLERNTIPMSSSAPSSAKPSYYAMSPSQQWQGPLPLNELALLPWLTPLTWISTSAGGDVLRAWKDPLISLIFGQRLMEGERTLSPYACPSCRQPLITASYEGTIIQQCSFCAGTLVDSDKVPRIIARTGRDQPCSERITALARTVLKENQSRQLYRMRQNSGKANGPLLPCPKCNNPMRRQFYSMSHLIEIDRCGYCGVTWFDQNELQMLQCMIHHRLTAERYIL
ncbi:MAG: zinc metalloprotease HtpX [Nitrospirota bacterium]|nr:zinc metalloprotease HtpX [Nitrospirota bacterium]